jgi:diguanylate cyclase (GGDEF)-like protein
MRIIAISLLLTLIYLYGVILILRERRRFKDMVSWELFLLFFFSSLFYLMRSIVTAMEMGTIKSLFDPSLLTTASFLFVIVYNLAFMMSMFNASLKKKNSLIIREKAKQESLFNFLNDTARHLNLDELYKSIEEVLRSTLGVGTALIYLRDERNESHTLAYHFKDLDVPLEDVRTFRRGEGASGRAIEEDRVIIIEMKDYPIRAVVDNYIPLGVTEVLSVPLKSSEGIIGAVSLILTEKSKSRYLDQDFFYYLGEQIGLVLHNAFLYEKVSALANTDHLTGLNNRRSMMEILKQENERALRHGRGYSLVMADLDHFKRVNDSYGHDCGDEVLKAAASLITASCRSSDTVCRWGGEEFLILLIETGSSEAALMMERLRVRVEELRLSCLQSDALTISVGISSFSRDESIEQMIARADEALYRAKKTGRNRIEIN